MGGKKGGGGGDALRWSFGVAMHAKRGRVVFIGKGDSHYVNYCYIETLLQVLLGIVIDFIGFPFSLYYCCFVSIEIGNAKSAV